MHTHDHIEIINTIKKKLIKYQRVDKKIASNVSD